MSGKVEGGRITVIVVDDHEVVRLGLRTLLAAEPDIEIIGEAASGRAAVAQVKELKPDIVVMDLAMPLLNGVEATRQILEECSSVKVVALSSYSDLDHVQQAVAAGASGYLLKGMAPGDLIQALYEVHSGHRYFSPAIAHGLPGEDECRKQVLSRQQADLSIREAEVLQLIAEGMTNKRIADELNLSIKTIEKHRHALMGKLDMHNIAALVRYAVSRKTIEGGCIEESQVEG